MPSLSQQGMASVAEETVVPHTHHDSHHHDVHLSHDGETTAAHIYFKDLKLLAHGEDSEDDHHDDDAQESDGGSSAAISPVADGTVSNPLPCTFIAQPKASNHRRLDTLTVPCCPSESTISTYTLPK